MLRHVERVMGMPVSFTLAPADASPDGSAPRVVCEWLHWVDATFSTFRDDSEVSRIHQGSLPADRAHPLVRDVLDLCDDLYLRSDGIFDPYARGRLDPAGLVKGWAVERAAERLVATGSGDFTINAGGDIATRGLAAPGRPWRTGIRHPDDSSTVVKVVDHDEHLRAIATSGAYERGDHVVDVRTNAGPSACRSATVAGPDLTFAGPDLTFADAYATVLFVLGEDGLDWLAQQDGNYSGYVIVNEQRARGSGTFAAGSHADRSVPSSHD